MNPPAQTTDRKSPIRKPGQRPTARQREELLVLVERALIRGSRTPTEVLSVVPALGTWDTARAYVATVRAGWRRVAGSEALRESRSEMIAAVAQARERALAGLAAAEKPGEIARLSREIERLVRCEAWLFGLESEGGGPGEIHPEPLEPRDWIPDEIDYLTEEMEKAEAGEYRSTLVDLIDTLKSELHAAAGSGGPENPGNPSSARTNPAHHAAREPAAPDDPAAVGG